jgi:DNA helicase-2/ATP-dependent DNA helicase PcrA
MMHRVSALLDGSPGGLTMGTFHATCVRILRRENAALEKYDNDFVIFDADDQRQLVTLVIRDLNLDDKKFAPNRMLNAISAAKNELVTAEEYVANNYITEITRRVYERYQKLLIVNNAMDFDDLLMNTVLLFDDRADILARYRQRYEHILVDEFQDTNMAQYELLQRLSGDRGNLFVVGDADQSIYKWRGADFRNIHRFRQQFPNAQMILLEQNYRSTQIILDAAKAIIRHNQDRVDKELFTEREGGVPISVFEAYNETEEAEAVVEHIERLARQGISPRNCAVMYRTNAQSRVLEEAFLRANMNYRLVNATRFYSRREIKDIIAYLRVVHNPADSISFTRMVNTPTRGIGRKTLEGLRTWASTLAKQPGEALHYLVSSEDVQHPFNSRSFKALAALGTRLKEWIEVKEAVSVSELMLLILDSIDYRAYVDIETDEGRDRWANIMELRGAALESEEVSLAQFLEKVALVSDVDDLEEDPDVPTLLTLHAAKGLEFPVVFIIGLEEGMLPHSRSIDDAEELAEERRLFYVGLTRAKDQVFLSHAFRRTFFGLTEVSSPSRFLLEIPEDLLDGETAGRRRHLAKQRASSWQWSSTKSPGVITGGREDKDLPEPYSWILPAKTGSPSLVESQYRTGQKVTHAKFGEGIVVESKITGIDEEVVVAFTDVGVKKLVASLAKLEILNE